MDITLDDVLTILDKHYNNVKVLDALNQELFQLRMADKETVLDWGICLSRNLQVLATSLPWSFSPKSCLAELKRDCFYSRPSQVIKSNGSLPKGRSAGETVLRLPKGHLGGWAKEHSIELPWGPRTQTTDGPPKPRTTSFFPLRKLKGN